MAQGASPGEVYFWLACSERFMSFEMLFQCFLLCPEGYRGFLQHAVRAAKSDFGLSCCLVVHVLKIRLFNPKQCMGKRSANVVKEITLVIMMCHSLCS